MLFINLLAGFRHAPTQVINMSDEDNVLDTGEAEVVADENHAGEAEPETPPETADEKVARLEKELEKSRQVEAKLKNRVNQVTKNKGDELRARMERLESQLLNSRTPQEGRAVSRDDFQSDNDYVEAISKGVTKTEIREMIAAEKAHAEVKEFDDKCEKILSEAAKLGDFDPDDFKPLPPASVHAILDSDIPAKIVAHLHLNPDEYERIAELSPTKQVREIARLEAKLSEQKPVKSNAPKPISPISGSSAKNLEYRTDMTDEEYDKWTAQQHKQRR